MKCLNLKLNRECLSPDGSGILFVFSLKTKRYSGQQVYAPEKYSVSFRPLYLCGFCARKNPYLK